jgi:hypothetical protein
LGLKTLLSGNRDQWAHFDDLFDAFWFGRGLRAVTPAQAEAGVRNRNPRPEIWDKVLPREETGSAIGRSERARHRSADRKPG